MKLLNTRNAFYALISFAICVCIVRSESSKKLKIVETENGKIRGIRRKTLINAVEYYSFKGIPYAHSPTGTLRFKPPEPVEPWAPKVLDAFQHGPTCMQPIRTVDYWHNENCLFLNVYVPSNVKPDEKLAVLVYIHGGAFAVGSGNSERSGPDFLLEQNVIVVTMNYRLGIFGFLSLGTSEYSGNMGLKDQQLALKWVHSNIEHFSGDKQRITLFGISAGGASVHFQALSSESRRYFCNIIALSGTVNNFWALSTESDHLKLAHNISRDLKQTTNSADELIEFIRTAPAHKVVNYASVSGLLRRTCQFDFVPIIERKDAIRPFIVESPSQIYETSEVDIDAMFSFCSAEYTTFYSVYADEIYNVETLESNFNLTLPFREADLTFDSVEYLQIARKIREFYFKNVAINRQSVNEYMQLLSDLNFSYGIDKSARQHASKSKGKTFYYRFAIDSKLNVIKGLFGDGGALPGAGHGDDSCYIFRCSFAKELYDDTLKNRSKKSSKELLKMIENTTKLLANFAKYGEPTHNSDPIAGFQPIKGNKMHFLDVKRWTEERNQS